MWRPKSRTLPDGRPGAGPAPPVPSLLAGPARPPGPGSCAGHGCVVGGARIAAADRVERDVDQRHPGRRVIARDIGVVGPRQRPIGGDDRGVVRRSGHPECGVWVVRPRFGHSVVGSLLRCAPTLPGAADRRRAPSRGLARLGRSWTHAASSRSSMSRTRPCSGGSRPAPTRVSTIGRATTGRMPTAGRRPSGSTGWSRREQLPSPRRDRRWRRRPPTRSSRIARRWRTTRSRWRAPAAMPSSTRSSPATSER